MAITFNTNLAALGAQRNIGIASGAASSSLSKLSSGSRVPQAKDDAAGLAIGSKLKSEVAGLTQASNNAAQAISLLQIADGALSTIGDVLQRMKALAVQSSSGQLDDASRSLLHQEFLGLRNEVDRVAGLTNFNGTTLLAGSTTVESRTNGLVSYNGTTNDTAATNLIGQGFDDIEFADTFGDGAIKIEYNGSTRDMTVTNLATNASQTIRLSATAIGAGSTEDVNFGNIGVQLSLNSQFNKATSIAATNTANVTAAASATAYTVAQTIDAAASGGTLVIDVTTTIPQITAVTFNDTEAGPFGSARTFGESLVGVTLTANTTVQTALTFADVTIAGRTFSQTSAAVDLTSTGNKTFTFADSNGNSFTVQIDVDTVANAALSAGTTITIAAGTTGGQIQASGSAGADTRPKITGVTVDGTNPFDFGTMNNAAMTINGATASASVLTMTQNGVSFSATVDLTSNGLKTAALVDADGNAINVQFNVTRAFADGDVGRIVFGDVGQVVASNSTTAGSTSFSFKVGSGTTVNDDITFALNSATTTALGISGSEIDSASDAGLAITAVNAAITAIASRRADIGAAQSRLDFASNSISVAIENTTAAASALLDVDVSAEITKFTNQNVLMQAGISLLGQANQQPALLLRLLQ